RHGFDAVPLQAAWQALRHDGQSPQSLLVSYFVSDTGADEELVFRIGNRSPGGGWELRIVDEPPQHRVRVEQQPHTSRDPGSVMPKSSVYFPSAASRSSGSMGSSNASF